MTGLTLDSRRSIHVSRSYSIVVALSAIRAAQFIDRLDRGKVSE
jgi:hypothetical protein